MNLDSLNQTPARETVQTAYAALSGAQSSPPHQQVMGAALLFHLQCELLQLDPSEMLDKARRLRRIAADNYSLEVYALEEYIRHQLRDKR